jgi:hypothetical protein
LILKNKIEIKSLKFGFLSDFADVLCNRMIRKTGWFKFSAGWARLELGFEFCADVVHYNCE